MRRKTQLSLHVPGYAPYGYGYPPHPYQYAPPQQPYAQAPQQGQMPPPPPYPYYYAPPPPHGYWAPPHAPMTVPQGAYYPGATASSASSVSSSASQTECAAPFLPYCLLTSIYHLLSWYTTARPERSRRAACCFVS